MRWALLLALMVWATSASAQTTISSPDGRKQVQAMPTATPIVVDGALDEDVWRLAAPATDFIQADPLEGQPATEATEVRIAYDADYLYIGATCRDTTPSASLLGGLPRRQRARVRQQDRHARSDRRVRARVRSSAVPCR